MRPRALLVEDDDSLREHYRICLEMSGYTVDACVDGVEALHAVERRRPDIIILDLNLPRLHGRSVYGELHGHPKTMAIPIVVVTGAEVVPSMPGTRILKKPVSAERLVRHVEAVLQRCDAPAGSALRDVWLFTRGDESVRIVVRCDLMHVVVEGPKFEVAMHEFDNVLECMRYEARAERTLAAAGFTRERRPERRSGHDRRQVPRGPDRRRQKRSAAAD